MVEDGAHLAAREGLSHGLKQEKVAFVLSALASSDQQRCQQPLIGVHPAQQTTRRALEPDGGGAFCERKVRVPGYPPSSVPASVSARLHIHRYTSSACSHSRCSLPPNTASAS